MKIKKFRKIVRTFKYEAQIKDKDGIKRTQVWNNTNKLLLKGFRGIKTGITETAGPCLASYFNNKQIKVIIVLMGCKNSSLRWYET